MKSSMTFIEPLEPRIAPAALAADGKTYTWTDQDGDLATLHLSKPVLNSFNVFSIFHFNQGSANFDSTTKQQLLEIDLTALGSLADHLNITITAQAKPGGDGKVDVGFIKAAKVDSDLLQFTNGVDVGKISIQGDLGGIYAGDQYADTAIQKLDVESLGAINGIVQNDLTSPSGTLYNDLNNHQLRSLVLGPVGNINIHGDLDGTYGAGFQVLGQRYSNIGSLHIGGSLIGGDGAGSGEVLFMHRIGDVTIEGDMTGGAGENSGSLVGYENAHTKAGKITIGGSVTGGSGTSSGSILLSKGTIAGLSIGGDLQGGSASSAGSIQAINLGAVNVEGSIVGGSASNTGYMSGSASSLNIGGDIHGGSSSSSGSVSVSGNLKTVMVGGSIVGGTGSTSGALSISGSVKTFSITGNIVGTNAANTGYVNVSGDVQTLTIGKDLDGDSIVGGKGANSGQLNVSGNINSLTLSGSLIGGTGGTSGAILVGNQLKTAVINGSVEGGSTVNATTSLDKTGYIQAAVIKDLTIAGNVTAGVKTVLGSEATTGVLTNSGAIRATTAIEKLTIGGNVTGTTDCAVVISAGGHTSGKNISSDIAIGEITIGDGTTANTGDVTYANILAGYTPASSSALGNATDADASIGTVTIHGNMSGTNVVAGVSAGSDGKFGTNDDSLISGGTNRASLTATIASIIVGGQVNNTASASDTYGIVAQWIKAIEVDGNSVALNPGHTGVGQDAPAKPVVTGSDTNYLEVT